MIKLHALPITAENFAPFGWLVAQPAGPPDLTSEGDLDYWDRIVPYGEALVAPNLGVLRLEQHQLEVSSLERIPEHDETYFDLEKRPAVLVVAPNLDDWGCGELGRMRPDLERVSAFDLGGHSVVVLAGVWHAHPYPYESPSRYALLTSGGTITRDSEGNVVVGDTQVFTCELPEPIEIVVGNGAADE